MRLAEAKVNPTHELPPRQSPGARKVVALGADHGGFRLKERLKAHLEGRGLRVVDCGTDSDASVDYPDYAHAVAEAIATGEAEFGILICGTGIGMSIAA